MPYEPDNEFPDHEEFPLDAGDAGLWSSGVFGDVEPEDRPIGVWGSVDANGEMKGGFEVDEPFVSRRFVWKPSGDETDSQGDIFAPRLIGELECQRLVNEGLTRFTQDYFRFSTLTPGLLLKKSTLWKRSDVYFFFVLWFLFGIIAGLFIAAWLDARVPK